MKKLTNNQKKARIPAPAIIFILAVQSHNFGEIFAGFNISVQILEYNFHKFLKFQIIFTIRQKFCIISQIFISNNLL